MMGYPHFLQGSVASGGRSPGMKTLAWQLVHSTIFSGLSCALINPSYVSVLQATSCKPLPPTVGFSVGLNGPATRRHRGCQERKTCRKPGRPEPPPASFGYHASGEFHNGHPQKKIRKRNDDKTPASQRSRKRPDCPASRPFASRSSPCQCCPPACPEKQRLSNTLDQPIQSGFCKSYNR